LWAQQERHNGMKIKKEPGATNLADLGTKAHPQNRFEELRSMVGMIDCSRVDDFTPLSACAVQCDSEEQVARPTSSSSGVAKAARQATAILMAALQVDKAYGFCSEWHERPEPVTSIDWTKWFSILLNVMLIAGIVYVAVNSRKPKKDVMVQTEESCLDVIRVRSIACQSQCTYKWQWQKPEFRVLPQQSAGCSLAFQ